MLAELAMKALAPMLNKVVDAFDGVNNNYGVSNSYFVIHEVYDSIGRRSAAITFMGTFPNGNVDVVKDNDGNDLTFPVSKLMDLIQGNVKVEKKSAQSEEQKERIRLERDRYNLKNGESIDDLDPADKYLDDED